MNWEAKHRNVMRIKKRQNKDVPMECMLRDDSKLSLVLCVLPLVDCQTRHKLATKRHCQTAPNASSRTKALLQRCNIPYRVSRLGRVPFVGFERLPGAKRRKCTGRHTHAEVNRRNQVDEIV